VWKDALAAQPSIEPPLGGLVARDARDGPVDRATRAEAHVADGLLTSLPAERPTVARSVAAAASAAFLDQLADLLDPGHELPEPERLRLAQEQRREHLRRAGQASGRARQHRNQPSEIVEIRRLLTHLERRLQREGAAHG
jgi:hypothetical protein